MLLLNRKMYDIFNQIFYEAKQLAQRSERHMQFKRNRTVFILNHYLYSYLLFLTNDKIDD